MTIMQHNICSWLQPLLLINPLTKTYNSPCGLHVGVGAWIHFSTPIQSVAAWIHPSVTIQSVAAWIHPSVTIQSVAAWIHPLLLTNLNSNQHIMLLLADIYIRGTTNGHGCNCSYLGSEKLGWVDGGGGEDINQLYRLSCI